MSAERIERDSMGGIEVPATALYGASTQRAVLNFPVSGYRFGRGFIRALGLIKYAAAVANEQLGKLDPEVAGPIKQAAREVINGQHDNQFVVDVFQTGSGTSTNMNANEVIASRALQLGGWHGQAPLARGSENGDRHREGAQSQEPLSAGRGASPRFRIHPNDHVNMSQSSNDVIPSAIRIAAVEALTSDLLPALGRLQKTLHAKAAEFDDIIKIGRTHLMDATPIRLGQVFSGYVSQVAQAAQRIEGVLESLRELPIGGTAVGTGVNTHPEFAQRVCTLINQETGGSFREAANHFAAQAAQDVLVGTGAALKLAGVSLTKVANDIRWLGSGPRGGIGELRLPATQPGSSIIPGKVNPVICEAVLQVCAQVVGAEATVACAGSLLGSFELHVGLPVMAYNLLEAIRLLSNVCNVFVDKCLTGLQADRQRCAELIERSLAMCTALAPEIGYDRAAALAHEAYATGKSVRQIALEKRVLDADRLNELLDARRMTEPG